MHLPRILVSMARYLISVFVKCIYTQKKKKKPYYLVLYRLFLCDRINLKFRIITVIFRRRRSMVLRLRYCGVNVYQKKKKLQPNTTI